MKDLETKIDDLLAVHTFIGSDGPARLNSIHIPGCHALDFELLHIIPMFGNLTKELLAFDARLNSLSTSEQLDLEAGSDEVVSIVARYHDLIGPLAASVRMTHNEQTRVRAMSEFEFLATRIDTLEKFPQEKVRPAITAFFAKKN